MMKKTGKYVCADKDSDSYNDSEDYYNDNGYDEDDEWADYKEYPNSLSSEELKKKDARDSKLWKKYKKDDDIKWNEWCN